MLVPAEIWTVAKTDQGNAVLVRPLQGDKAVPILIGPLEAQNILLGLGEVEIPRPLTHDLLLRLLTELGATLVRIDIHTLSEGTYYSNILLSHGTRKLEIDARPSDALALAVRTDCPIFLETDLLEESGISLDQLQESAQEADLEDLPTDTPAARSEGLTNTLVRLQAQLDLLVANEDYEEAALVRDQIRRLEEPGKLGG
ncbi:MAG: bifunctional nuclease domain-containing protein [Spirochaetales bacterium]